MLANGWRFRRGVWLTAGTLSGNGTISVSGGNGQNSAAGGGGGRIAVYYTTDSSTISYQAYGGTGGSANVGGAGTIFKKISRPNEWRSPR